MPQVQLTNALFALGIPATEETDGGWIHSQQYLAGANCTTNNLATQLNAAIDKQQEMFPEWKLEGASRLNAHGAQTK